MNTNIKDIEYDIEESYISGLRAIFTHDEEFTYNSDNSLSRVIITSTYPEKDEDFKIPQILVTGINFQLSQTSLFNNFLDDIIENNQVVGQRFATQIPYSVTLTCLSSNDGTSKNLCNKVLNYVWFVAYNLLNDVLLLGITDVQKSPGGMQRNLPDKAFAHSIGIRGNLNWMGKRYQDGDLIEKIRVSLVDQHDENLVETLIEDEI